MALLLPLAWCWVHFILQIAGGELAGLTSTAELVRKAAREVGNLQVSLLAPGLVPPRHNYKYTTGESAALLVLKTTAQGLFSL